VRFEVLTAVKMSLLVFWVITPCGLIGRYQHSCPVCNHELYTGYLKRCIHIIIRNINLVYTSFLGHPVYSQLS
jgi:hypothetical protein